MKHTQIVRMLVEPPESVRLQLEQILPHTGYTWTGFAGARYGIGVVWRLEIWNIDDRYVMLIDTLLSEYYVEED